MRPAFERVKLIATYKWKSDDIDRDTGLDSETRHAVIRMPQFMEEQYTNIFHLLFPRNDWNNVNLSKREKFWGCSDEVGDNNQKQHINIYINDEDYGDGLSPSTDRDNNMDKNMQMVAMNQSASNEKSEEGTKTVRKYKDFIVCVLNKRLDHS